MHIVSQRQHYGQWIEDYLRRHHPELVPDMSAVLKAFDTSLKTGVLTSDKLKTLVDAAHSSRQVLGENSAALLGELVPRFLEAERAVRAMATHAKFHVRRNALVAISATKPTEFHRYLLRISLKDRSLRLRMLSADKIMQLGLSDLLPDLETSIEAERNPKVRANLEWQRDLLRDGYHVEYRDPKTVWITSRRPNGSTAGALITDEVLRTKGAKTIADELSTDGHK